MILDLQTLSFVLIFVALILALVMVFVCFVQKIYSGFKFWVVSHIIVAFGILLLGFDGAWVDILGTSMTFGAVLIGYEGDRRFLQLKNTILFSFFILFLHTGSLFYFKFFDNNNVILQVSFTSLLVAVISSRSGFIYAKKSTGKMNFSHKLVSITYFIFASAMFSRTFLVLKSGNNADFYKTDGIQPVFFLIYIIFEIAMTFNYINLNTNRLYKDLKQTEAELEKLATTDFLTEINNNRSFYETGEREFQRSIRFGHPLSVIMFDIDFFKRVNDNHGHAAGDMVLVRVAEVCKARMRSTDTIGRLGGEEFGILLPHTKIEGAKIVAEHLRSSMEMLEINHLSEVIKITASFGVSEIKETDSHIKTSLDRVDFLLYKAKNKGRNTVVLDDVSVDYKGLITAGQPVISAKRFSI